MTQPESPAQAAEPGLTSAIDELSPVLVQVRIEVPWHKVSADLEDAYRVVQKQARVRGFRPGKVPRGVVKQLMGKSVRQEVVNGLVQRGLGEAIQTHDLNPVAIPEIDQPEIADGKPLSFTAKIEVRPKIESVNTVDIRVERVRPEVSDEQLAQELERLREQNAELVTPETPRAAQAGDVVSLDIVATVEGEPRPDLSSSDMRAELGSDQLLPELEEALIGALVGDKKEVALSFPEDAGDEGLRGKSAILQVELKQLQARVLPELDDEFAKDLDHDSLDALRAETRRKLEEVEQRRSQARLKEAVIDALIDKNPVPVPPSLVEQHERTMLMEFFRFQQMLGRSLPFDDDTKQEFHTRAERKVRAGLLFGEIARQQNIESTDADIEAKLEELAKESGKHIAKVRADYQGERRDELRAQVLEHKLLEYLLAQATIKDVSTEELAKRAEAKPEPPSKQEAAEQSADETTGGATEDRDANAEQTAAEGATEPTATKSKKKSTKKAASGSDEPKGETQAGKKKTSTKKSSKSKKEG